MTLPIKVQIANAKKKLTDAQIDAIIAKGQTFPEKTREKRTLDMLKVAARNVPKGGKALAPTPTEVPMPSGDAGPSTEKSPLVPAEGATSAKKSKRSDAPTKKDKAIKSPPQSRKLGGSGLVAVRRGESGKMDLKNTVLNAIKAAEKAGVKKVTSEEIKAQFEKHNVKMDDGKLRMSLGNLARDERIKRVAHGVYKSL